VNVGVRPTFGPGARLVEAFVLDFDGDLYGETVGLSFTARLRDERKFDSVPELVEQMAADVEQTRRLLS
jgi:riboflavin kinase/FMN adenylyltransferase